MALAGDAQRRLAVRGFVEGGVSGGRQRQAQQLADLRLVIDNEYG